MIEILAKPGKKKTNCSYQITKKKIEQANLKLRPIFLFI